MIRTILLIGCGNLGKRYVETIDNNLKNVKILIVDPYVDFSTLNIKNICFEYHKDISDIKDTCIDLAIFAVCSDIRYTLTVNVIQKFTVKYIIFEKFLFQKENDYYEVKSLLKSNNIKSWVNTPRPTYEFYKKIKKHNINLTVFGKNWGLACNAIHFIDLFCFLNNSYDITLEDNDLVISNSKRKNFYEFYGTIRGKNKENTLVLKCDKGEKFQLIKTLNGTKIENKNGKLYVDNKVLYKIPYLSEYMHKIIEDILCNDDCDLTKYDNSMKIHLSLLRVLTKHFKGDVLIT